MRVHLAVPWSERADAKKLAAQWDPVLRLWWINRHDLAANAGIYR
jgi:hypothetical protein